MQHNDEKQTEVRDLITRLLEVVIDGVQGSSAGKSAKINIYMGDSVS